MIKKQRDLGDSAFHPVIHKCAPACASARAVRAPAAIGRISFCAGLSDGDGANSESSPARETCLGFQSGIRRLISGSSQIEIPQV
jgi:hypothetical protein